MNILKSIKNLLKKSSYDVIPLDNTIKDVVLKHTTGVEITIFHDGSVMINSPKKLYLHSTEQLEISSNTHIGIKAPRIDLN